MLRHRLATQWLTDSTSSPTCRSSGPYIYDYAGSLSRLTKVPYSPCRKHIPDEFMHNHWGLWHHPCGTPGLHLKLRVKRPISTCLDYVRQSHRTLRYEYPRPYFINLVAYLLDRGDRWNQKDGISISRRLLWSPKELPKQVGTLILFAGYLFLNDFTQIWSQN